MKLSIAGQKSKPLKEGKRANVSDSKPEGLLDSSRSDLDGVT